MGKVGGGAGGPAWKARGNPWGPVQEEGIYFAQPASGTAGRVVLSGSEEFNCLSLLNFRAAAAYVCSCRMTQGEIP
jgi:hypothetical protein